MATLRLLDERAMTRQQWVPRQLAGSASLPWNRRLQPTCLRPTRSKARDAALGDLRADTRTAPPSGRNRLPGDLPARDVGDIDRMVEGNRSCRLASIGRCEDDRLAGDIRSVNPHAVRRPLSGRADRLANQLGMLMAVTAPQ